jgi:hypothetical protein
MRAEAPGKAPITVLTVVVVLDDPRVLVGGPVEHFDASLQCQRDTGWTLVRWRHHGQACFRKVLTAERDVETVVVDWHIQDLQSSAAERAGC